MDKVGVFLCTGCGIAEALDVEALAAAASDAGAADCTTHPCLCEPEGVALVREALGGDGLHGVVLAGCSQRSRADAFRFAPATTLVDRVPLREQVVWTHPPGNEDTQALAEDILRMGVAKVAKQKLPTPLAEEIDDTVLVVGGGLTGLQAASAAAAMGHPVVLVEASDRLGGHLAEAREEVPDRPPYDRLRPSRLRDLVGAVEDDPRVRIVKGAQLRSITGQPGQFQVEVACAGGGESFTAGAIVQATGARPYDASNLGHLGYGEHQDVVTSHAFEAMLTGGAVVRPSDGRAPRRVVFVQCAGSRDPEHLAYCSAECCTTTLRQVATLRRDHPEIEPYVVYKDIRTPGQREHFFLATQAEGGTLFTRGDVTGVAANGNGSLKVHLEASLLGEQTELEADLVVLAVGMVPNSADGEAIRALRDATHRAEHGESETQKAEARRVIEELGHHAGTEILNLDYRQGPDLPVLAESFPDSHFICFPYETRRTGIYAAGALRAPMDAAQAVEDAWGAALKAVQSIRAAREGEAVHPRSGDLGIPNFFLQRCTQCKRCTEECPFGTLNEDEKGTPQLNALRCRRCGICMGACPERIVSFPDYSVDVVSSMIKALEVPEEEDEKPRMIAFVCENDALPALDTAARLRRQWNPWVRVIPVRCLGSFNIVWIADALSRGIDGVVLIGCKYGDDYQCHYVRGSELAHKRLENVGETLNRLALESERIRVVELAHNEFDRIPEILDEFAATIDEIGPNPYKGF